MEIKKVTVIGAGEMGHGIAEIFLINGYEVNLVDVSEQALQKAKQLIEESLKKFVERGKIKPEDVAKFMSKLTTSTNLEESVKDSDMIIEAVPEKIEIKADVLGRASKVAKPDAIIGTNTSNIKITDLSQYVNSPWRFLGTHFFNPPVIMKLVELVKGEKTDDKVLDDVYNLMKTLGKEPIKVMKDTPGFIVNRVSAPELLFFCLVADQNLAKPEEVDAFAKEQGLPMGPYELMDYVGLDVVYDSLLYFSKTISPDYGKCKTVGELVKQGKLGKKSGYGFYQWSGGKAVIPKATATDKVNLLDVLVLEVNEAVKLIEEGVATPDDVETAVKLGLNRPFGPITVAKSLTNDEVKSKLLELYQKFNCDVFKPAKSIEEGRLKEVIEGMYKPQKPKEKEKTTVMEQQTPSAFKYLKLENLGNHVLRILIDRPKRNFLSPDVIEELDKAIESIWNDRDIWAVVLTGAGADFSAGADLSTYIADGMQFIEFSRRGERVFRKLAEIPKVTIAEMKGYVLGGGFELALACDIRVTSSDATIGFPETTLGLLPGWGGTQRLAKLTNMNTALWLILTGKRISGEEAFRLGIASQVYDKSVIDEETVKLAKEITSNNAPIAEALAKRLINKATEVPMDIGLEWESTAFGILFNTEDLKEGISSLFEKRKPNFRGR
ncbi:MAG: 3-hydroxyacyl-CoA dehydrogenase NAD-binding domain-containing protein [Nitrososphaeria archaeon]|nr:3-hydroxyacyl-CoA dehydrogenase/enoyl-CoA hydratase family protein [Conexivisphaerales archaeon]